MSLNSPYGIRSGGGMHGDVFTSALIVGHMLDLVGYTADKDLSNITLLEPACGDGSFLTEVARRLMLSSKAFSFDPDEAFDRCVSAYDIDEDKVLRCKERLRGIGIRGTMGGIGVGDFLRVETSPVDIVVGNPPYIRYENIPQESRDYCKQVFRTFHYRADLYVPFFEKTLNALRPGGLHCFVCANRWLKNEYGRKLRSMIASRFSIQRIINIEHAANSFHEEVLAYPAITLIANHPPAGELWYADCDDIGSIASVQSSVRPMPRGEEWGEVFFPYGGQGGLCRIEELGFRIGIGVATGADDVFVSKGLPDCVEAELLLPAIGARDLRGDTMKWNGEYLLNPYTPSGGLVDLDLYPMAHLYLNKHRERLSARHVAQKDVRKWYRTIDRICPEIRFADKILLPDMSGNRYVFIDEGNYYPLHNLYYITGHGLREQKLLSAMLMSDLVRGQVKSITNNMNGGFPRWQSQYLRKIRIPDILGLSPMTGDEIIECYVGRDYRRLNEIVGSLFADRNMPNPAHMSRRAVQTSLTFA